jgi:CBS domain-containing protein
VVVVGPQFPLEAAWRIMQERRIRHLPVVRAKTLVGILSDRDILLRATQTSDGTVVVPRDPVALAMTPGPITRGPECLVSDLARTMIEHKIDAIPVIGASGSLIGLVTSSDLMLLLVEDVNVRALPFDFRVYDGERLAAQA